MQMKGTSTNRHFENTDAWHPKIETFPEQRGRKTWMIWPVFCTADVSVEWRDAVAGGGITKTKVHSVESHSQHQSRWSRGGRAAHRGSVGKFQERGDTQWKQVQRPLEPFRSQRRKNCHELISMFENPIKSFFLGFVSLLIIYCLITSPLICCFTLPPCSPPLSHSFLSLQVKYSWIFWFVRIQPMWKMALVLFQGAQAWMQQTVNCLGRAVWHSWTWLNKIKRAAFRIFNVSSYALLED